MPVQKRRKSAAKRDSKRAQWMRSVKVPTVQHCPRCQAAKVSHRVCMSCGHYDGQKVIDVETAAE